MIVRCIVPILLTAVPALAQSAAQTKRTEDQLASPQSISPLTEAVWKGDVTRVKRLLAAGEDPNSRDFQGLSPWKWAIIAGENEALTMLLETIPVIGNDDIRGASVLAIAAAQNNLLAARELIKRGVPVDA